MGDYCNKFLKKYLTKCTDSTILLPPKAAKFLRWEDVKLGETEIGILKAKCNALIDKALQKKQELEELDSKIEKLQDIKKSIEERLENEMYQPAREQENESAEGYDTKVDEETGLKEYESQEKFVFNYNQILQMLQALSNQTSNPQENIRVRKVTAKEKIWETVQDILGKIGKLILMLLLTAVLSLAATILLNAHLREMFMDILKQCINLF